MSRADHFLFFTKEVSKEVLVLSSDEVAHLTTVLRFGPGDEIQVTDGKGMIYECRIEKMKRDMALCSILSSRKEEAVSPAITLYVGVPDRDRLETLCDELPPLGVSRIVPVMMNHSKKNWWGSKWKKSEERFNRKIVASIKQSMNPYYMTVEQPVSFEDAMEQITGTVLFCDEHGAKLADLTPETLPDETSLVVGPPGGITEEETAVLKEKGSALALAPYRLRTELAATTGVALLNQWRI